MSVSARFPEQGCFIDGLHVQVLAHPAQGWVVSQGNLAMELEYLGMGVDGEYNPHDPEDVPSMSCTFRARLSPGCEWEYPEVGSITTNIDATSSWIYQVGCAVHIFQQMVEDLCAKGEDPVVSPLVAWEVVSHILLTQITEMDKSLVSEARVLAAMENDVLADTTPPACATRLAKRL